MTVDAIADALMLLLRHASGAKINVMTVETPKMVVRLQALLVTVITLICAANAT